MTTTTQSSNAISLDGESLTLHQAISVSEGQAVEISTGARTAIEKSRNFVEQVAEGDVPVYGINTGFGFFSRRRISAKDLQDLQSNIIKSHAAGHGEPLSIPETRLAMTLRLNVLTKGYTGVRYELCQALADLINAEIYPLIPEFGSVGASGDLAPLAHLALPLLGLGSVRYQGEVMDAAEALSRAGLEPITLAEKEGLSLINGTQIHLAVGSYALEQGLRLSYVADRIAALSLEGMDGLTDAWDAPIHQVRNHPAQMAVAERLRKELEGSYLYQKDHCPARVQDSYSLRCAPQVHGPSHDALQYSLSVVERELNAATDNPLVFVDQKRVISGGNFHGQPVAMALDFAGIALAELGNISERRLEQLFNPYSSGLNAFLTPYEGTHSGYMAAQYLSASLVGENKLQAHPACTDSIPGNVGVEDHVSMGPTAARKLRRIVRNLKTILAVELLAAAQAVDLRQVGPLGKGTQSTYNRLRDLVPTLDKDRVVANDISCAVAVVDQLMNESFPN